MEIYNESVKDLLSMDNTPRRLLDDPEKGTVVEKLTEETLRDQNHLKELLSFCEAQRQIGETSLNEMSSRSHQILRLTIESSARELLGKDNLSSLAATVNFVDLAGSERASQALTAGTRLKEGCHINRSLLTLGTVIRKLSKGRNGHIPYRDSKLTRILQHSLGGNARTAIICTMSPARSHIEQSRNTLLFASCAKEVSTNAEVNVVISDKALVKHLQRELARLENELRYPGLVSHSDALREKESQIKKMEKEMKELMQQRDLAQSRLEDLLQAVGDDQASRQWEDFDQFSATHEPITCEDVFSISDTTGVAYEIPDFDFTRSETSHGSYNQNQHYLQLSDKSKEPHATSPSQSVSSCMGQFPHLRREISLAKSEDSDNCKEVRCIEVDESLTSRSDEYDLILNEESDSLLPSTLDDNRHGYHEPKIKGILLPPTPDDDDESKTNGTLLPLILDDHEPKNKGTLLPVTADDHEPKSKEILQPPNLDDNCHGDHEPKIKENTYLNPALEQQVQNAADKKFVKPYPDELSILSLRELPSSRHMALARSRSCRATLMTRSDTFWFQEVEENNNIPPNNFPKDVPGKPVCVQRRRLSALNCGADGDFLSGVGYQPSEKSTSSNVLKEQNSMTCSEENISSLTNFVEGMKEMAQMQYQKQLTDGQEVEQKVNKGCGVERDVKDLGLDMMQNSSEAPSQWPPEFERKQWEIILLWQACHVSLVHRTYFFLLFKGDPADSIYMEVEHRRLSFLKGSLSEGSLDKLMLGMKNLRREREMLRKQMLKRLSREERENLYTKWGIALDSKQRRVQLARRIWSETTMEHVRESASLVAKLIGLLEPGQALKEMFGLNFAPELTNSRSYSRKHRLSSFL